VEAVQSAEWIDVFTIIKPILDQFLQQGKRISSILYQEVLDMAGEI
jgi:predicted nucleic acid-binding protein